MTSASLLTILLAALVVAGCSASEDRAPARTTGATRPANALMVISPYWHDGTWVFDDPATGLVREPFIAGARSGFRLTFSGEAFPGHQKKLTWVRAESGGNWYRFDDPPMEGWLCPAMFHYFAKAPQSLYVRVDPKG